MKYLILVSLFFTAVMATDDVELYNKLNQEVSKKENIIHKKGDIKVVVKAKDTKLTKKIKKLLEKDKVAKATKKYETILKD